MRICIDTTILIDILKDEFRSFQEIFYAALSTGETLVCPVVVFAELLPMFEGDEVQSVAFLKEHKIKIEALDQGSATAAARGWLKYLRRKTRSRCPQCGKLMPHKEHLLSDFYVGGFASTKCDAVLTRDRGVYVKYFPDLRGYGNCLKC
jgi:predicted nucleic acid-binding protein